ncbi:PREDICTED: UPF0258 protein KIAA1024-like homolog [Thamnophis sirtalis]|uniref:UPF0258 protein KIAA1024-like homolog n=1 Tax=Thamnophis sirtalis TaxID=35019 RepID=A0A6I9X5W3_9SAUR|nr:PREDICTED: UPF0258 protein KIAA1024-like homolog [Thamnophis sirtalis]
MIDKALGKHVTPVTLKSTIKSNPLYDGILADDCWEKRRHNPSWTVQDYDRHSNTSLPYYIKNYKEETLEVFHSNPLLKQETLRRNF